MSNENETVNAEKMFRTAVTVVTASKIFHRRASFHAVCIICRSEKFEKLLLHIYIVFSLNRYHTGLSHYFCY